MSHFRNMQAYSQPPPLISHHKPLFTPVRIGVEGAANDRESAAAALTQLYLSPPRHTPFEQLPLAAGDLHLLSTDCSPPP
mmetsp:Transcript_16709/g.46454  ORF Transcript_16709/g.46454 Transcript_16709/m.46454 type:complete len:80 (-) Transcript_16709:359-598(-)